MIYYLSLFSYFVLHSDLDTTIYLDFSAFTSKPISFLAINKASVFPYIMYAPSQ